MHQGSSATTLLGRQLPDRLNLIRLDADYLTPFWAARPAKGR